MADSSVTNLLFLLLAGVLVALIGGGVGAAGRRARLSGDLVGTVASVVIVGLLLWLGVAAALARSGVLKFSASHPPLEPLLPLSALVTFLLLSRTATFGALARSLPPWQPVAIQTFRIGVEFLFDRLYAEGRAPVQMTFEGRNFDILVGLTAPLVALGAASGWLGKRSLITWNLLGVGLLLNAIGTAATSAPGPQHLNWPGEPFAALGTWPVIWIPALFAPTAMSMHILSIRQAIGLGSDHPPASSKQQGRNTR